MQKSCKGGGGGGKLAVFFFQRGGSCKQRQGEHWKTMLSPTAHKPYSLSCLMRIASEAQEELSESDLNEIIDAWQRKSKEFLHFN